tara:strand:- start:2264 stop:3748 length:1485 start_codon:yes stop_codon:yes gene_type:complete
MQHFYDAQIRRYILQFIRMMSNFSYITGKNSKGTSETLQVPVKYGDMSRQVAQIIKKGSENTLIPAPQISCYITDLRYDRERMYNPYHVDKKHIREREYDPSTGEYTGAPGQSHTIERIMPTPFELTFNADIFTTNTDQKLQILEQILVLFNPALELQTTDNFLDWTSLSFVELTNVNFTSRAIPQGIADEIDVATLTFRTPIFISPPAKLKKLGVIEKIVMSIFDEEAGKVDVDGILGESLLSKQFVTPGQYALLLLGNRMTLLGEASDNDATTANNKTNRAFESQSQFGNKIHWRKLEALYSKVIQNGLSKINLQQSATNINGDDIIVNVSGTVAIDPQDEKTLLFTVDIDTTPTNTMNAVDAIINPLTFNPDGVANGTRYLLTEAIGSASDDSTENNGPSAWGNLIASANDIIEKVDDIFVVDFNADFDDGSTQLLRGTLDSSSLGDSTFNQVHYVTNMTTGIQYKWQPTAGIWIKSYEGFYEPGTWSIEF